MKLLHNVLGILCGFALMIILLITSIEAVTYWTPGYYEKEYAKYGVLNDVHMEMDDLLDVTDEMMAYLRGSREDLHVPTIVDGQPREFFNDREIAHMEDVRGLFLGGLALRRISLGLIVACVILLLLLKADIRRVLPKMICIGSALFFAVLAVLAGIISTEKKSTRLKNTAEKRNSVMRPPQASPSIGAIPVVKEVVAHRGMAKQGPMVK